MSFFTLLLLLSLIIIVPVFFVMKEKSRKVQIDSTQRHQAYLAASHSASTSEINVSLENSNDESSIIKFSPRHSFVKLLYDNRVPKAFRVIMDSVGQQYENIHHDQITESQLFTLNKLIEIRIPELITDYLSLDPDYARTIIIDSTNSTTSYSMVLGQLQSILDFTQRLNTQSQSGVVDKILASRRYLDEVAQDSGMSHDILDIK